MIVWVMCKMKVLISILILLFFHENLFGVGGRLEELESQADQLLLDLGIIDGGGVPQRLNEPNNGGLKREAFGSENPVGTKDFDKESSEVQVTPTSIVSVPELVNDSKILEIERQTDAFLQDLQIYENRVIPLSKESEKAPALYPALTLDSEKKNSIDSDSSPLEFEKKLDEFLLKIANMENGRPKQSDESFLGEKIPAEQMPSQEKEAVEDFLPPRPLPSDRKDEGLAQEVKKPLRQLDSPSFPKKHREFKKIKSNEYADSPKISKQRQDKWDLFIFRELALENAPELLVKRAQIQVSEKGMSALRFARYPTFKAKVGITNYTKIASSQTWDPDPYSSLNYGLEGRWVLYDGHKARIQTQTAKLEVDQSKLSLLLEEQKVLRSLIEHYFSVLSAQSKVFFLPQIEAVINLRKAVYSEQIKSGFLDRLTQNKILRELEDVRSQRMNGKMNLELSKSEIGFILNSDESFWEKYDEFSVPPDFVFQKDLNINQSTHGKLGDAGVQIAQSRYNEVKTGQAPVLELTGNAGYRGRDKIGIDSNGQELTVGLNLTLPITDYFHTRSKLEKAREEIYKSEADRHHLITQHENQFLSETLKLELAEKNYEFQSELLNLQIKRLEDVRSVSRHGIFDKSRMLEEKEELLRREMSLEDARLAVIKHKYLLDLIE